MTNQMTDTADILLVLGTRPEIIKLAPVIESLQTTSLSFRLVHTGQHFDANLSGTFFDVLGLPLPDSSLGVGSGSHGQQTADALVGIEGEIQSTDPDLVVAQGDTNAVLSAALATSKTHPLFAHVEAGLRSFDRSMPEEVNRVLADQVTDLAFAPTSIARENLRAEAVGDDAIHVVGNTIVDAVWSHIELARRESTILRQLSLEPGSYAVATIHRPRNTDNDARLETILEHLDGLEFPVVFPVHPRTRREIDELGFESTGGLRLIEPVDYLDFLSLEENARLIITDSGGLQEEASIFEVPCITVRPNTERPETVEAGVNVLVEPIGLRPKAREVLSDSDVHERMTGHPNLYGEVGVGDRIVNILDSHLDQR